MTIGTGNLILASDYNAIQATVADVLGVGSGKTGYGQVVSSSQVTAGTSTITATQMKNLRSDLSKISYHQINSNTTAPDVNAGGSILASDWSTYSSQATTLSASPERFRLDSIQSTTTLGVNPTMSGWNSTRTHSVTVTFASANDARYFFNAGGEIRITPSISGQSSLKGSAWNSLFTTVGTVKFGALATTAGVTGTIVGWYNLTNVTTPTPTYPQTVFTYTGNVTYTGNIFTVKAYCNVADNSAGTASILYLDIIYNDAGTYPTGSNTFDENVDGTTTSTVSHYRATGSNVQVLAPTITGSSIA